MNQVHWNKLVKYIKNGLYEEICDYLDENELDVGGNRALNLLVACTHNLEKEYSSSHMIKLINRIQINVEDTEDLSIYVRSLYFILKFLIEAQQWPLIIQMGPLFLRDFISDKMENKVHSYYKTCVVLLCKDIYIMDGEAVKEYPDLIGLTIAMEKKYNPSGFMLLICKFAVSSLKQNLPTIGNLFIKTIFKSKIDIRNRDVFSEIITIMCCCFIPRGGKKPIQDANCQIKEIILRLQEVVGQTNDLWNLFNYMEASLFAEAEKALEMLQKLVSDKSRLPYLQDIIHFCCMWREEEKHRGRCHQEFRNFQMLRSYLSHVKSQALLLKHKPRRKDNCCKLETHVLDALKALIIAFEIVVREADKLATEEKPIPDMFYVALQKLTVSMFDLLKVLHDAGCPKTTYCWDIIAANIYKLAIKLAVQKRQNVSLKLLEPCVQGLFIYSDKRCTFQKSTTMAAALLYYYADCLLGYKRWSQAMDISALALHLFTEHRPALCCIWNKAVYNAKSDLHIYDVLHNFGPFLQQTCGNFKLTLNKRYLYSLEAMNYMDDLWSRSRADKCLKTMVSLFSTDAYYDQVLRFPIAQLYAQLPPVKEEVPKEIKYQCLHSYLSFREVYLKAVDSLPSDVYSLDKLCPALQLVEYCHILARLTDCADMFLGLNGSGESHNLLEIAICLSHDLELHCQHQAARLMWLTAYKFASKLQNNESMVHIGTYLFKYDFDDDIVKVLIEKCKLIASKSNQPNADAHVKCKFYSALAVYYLRNDRLAEYRNAYHIATREYSRFGSVQYGGKALNVQDALALGQYGLLLDAMHMVRCTDVGDEFHGMDMFGVLGEIRQSLMASMKQPFKHKFSEYMYLLLALSERVAHHYLWRRMRTDAKIIANSARCIAEQYSFAYWSCRFAVLIAQVEIAHEKYDKARCLQKRLFQILEEDDGAAADMSLKLSQLQITTTSPRQQEFVFQQPSFMQDENCKCIQCTDSEHHHLLLEAHNVQALIIAATADRSLFKKYMSHVFNWYEWLVERKQFWHPHIYENLLWTRIKHARTMCMHDDVKQDIERILRCLNRTKHCNLYLLTEVQNLQCMMHLEEAGIIEPPTCPINNRTPQIIVNSERSPIVKTPSVQEVKKVETASKPPLEIYNDSDGRVTRLAARKKLTEQFAACEASKTPKPAASQGAIKKTTQSRLR